MLDKKLASIFALLFTGLAYAQTAPCPTPPILNYPNGPECTSTLDPCQCSQDFYWDSNIIPNAPPAEWWEVFRRSKTGAFSNVWTPLVLVGTSLETRWWVAWDAGDSSRSIDDSMQRAGQQKPGFIYEYKVRSCRLVPESWSIVCSQMSNTVATYRGVAYNRSVR